MRCQTRRDPGAGRLHARFDPGGRVSSRLLFRDGASHYFHSVPFILKLMLFAIVGLLPIYPTVEFLSWRKYMKEGRAPAVSERKLRSIRAVIHWELIAAALLILCAGLMARGVRALSLPAS
ncbi:MAG: DUF2214 family protein [Burkholderiaceae bacterium]